MSRKVLGSTLIIAGCSIGAGMLALPVITLSLGFPLAVLSLCLVGALMAGAALLIARITLCFPVGSTLHTMVRETLGPWAVTVTSIATIWLGYSLLSAYIDGATSFLEPYLPFPKTVLSLLFLGVFGTIVFWKTTLVDHVNRWFFLLKTAAFALVVLTAFHGLDVGYMAHVPREFHSSFWGVLPVMVAAFGFHVVVPGVVEYAGRSWKTIVKAILWGSFIPLVIYVVWEALTLGSIAPQALITNVPEMIQTLEHKLRAPWLCHALDVFAQVGMITSFLGLSMGMRTFFSDMVRKQKASPGLVACLVFLPPTLITVLMPDIFVAALGFASIALLITALVLPGLVAWRLVKTGRLVLPRKMVILSMLMVALGLGVIALEIVHIGRAL